MPLGKIFLSSSKKWILKLLLKWTRKILTSIYRLLRFLHIWSPTLLEYVNTKSSHRANVIRHIPRGVECRIQRNSATTEIFERKKKEYVTALKEEVHSTDLTFKPQMNQELKSIRARKRKLIWFFLSTLTCR